ncbi:disks large homolog 5-like isoform X1 [Peromyscus eremicus]|uniref:disks large homolog 5-like isoform X1 n=1 Tax=Peromyscus eremicus TaxID=42410 RepID=UPI0027DDD4AF|nr:disks large homolog 5-like isoform X1 [Peromyscus eremicus]
MLSRLRHLLDRENGLRGDTRARQKEADPRSHWKEWRNQWSWGRCRTTGKTPTQTSTSTEQEQQMTKLEKLTLQLQSITYERIELHGILTSYTDMDLQNSYLHSQVLRDWTQRKESVHVLRLKNRQLWKEQIELQESCEELKRLLKEAHEMICDPSAEQHQEQESLDERLKDLLKQKELVTQQGDLAE